MPLSLDRAPLFVNVVHVSHPVLVRHICDLGELRHDLHGDIPVTTEFLIRDSLRPGNHQHVD